MSWSIVFIDCACAIISSIATSLAAASDFQRAEGDAGGNIETRLRVSAMLKPMLRAWRAPGAAGANARFSQWTPL
jgi:hypothetical protein